jgi:hypothetical protein
MFIVESGKFGESTTKIAFDFEINGLDSSLIELKTYKVFQSLARSSKSTTEILEKLYTTTI